MGIRDSEIVIVGAGIVGTALGVILAEENFRVRAVVSRRHICAQRAVERIRASTPSCAVEAVEDLGVAASLADLLLLAVPDREIGNVAGALAQSGSVRRGAIVAHTSGALSSDVLGPLSTCGARIASMHPLQSFADVELAVRILRRSAFVIEGGSEAVAQLKALAGCLSETVLTIRSEDKPLYHAAACLASNYLVTLLWAAVKLYQSFGIDEQHALSSLRPLVEGTLENAFRLGPVKALTGPIARGDAVTCGRHLDALEGLAETLPGLENLYTTMGLHTLVVAFLRGLSLEDAERVKEVLRRAAQGRE